MVFLKPSLRRHTTKTPIKIFSVLLVIIILLFSVASSSSSSEDQPIPAPATATYYRVYHMKNTTPYFLKNKQAQQWRRNKKKKAMEYYRKKMKGSSYIDIDTRAFSTMLPKGFVPPSGSSPCHNDFPNSITFFCQLSSQKP